MQLANCPQCGKACPQLYCCLRPANMAHVREPFSEIQPANTPVKAVAPAKGTESESTELIPRLVSKIADLEQRLYASDIWGGATWPANAISLYPSDLFETHLNSDLVERDTEQFKPKQAVRAHAHAAGESAENNILTKVSSFFTRSSASLGRRLSLGCVQPTDAQSCYVQNCSWIY